MITCVECCVVGKQPDQTLCEDAIYLGDHFAAVVDGATDKTGATYEGMTGGRYAASIITATIGSLPPQADARTVADTLTSALADHVLAGPNDVPSASAVIYSNFRREVWQVGDVSWTTCRGPLRQPTRKAVDDVAAGTRAALLQALLNSGVPLEELRRTDPGRQTIRPLLESQHHLRNAAGRWSYGAFDGTYVPDDKIGVWALPDEEEQLVIYSDGYPQPARTLADAERALASALRADPLCIGELAGTKGVQPGNASFDDRAYLRLAIGGARKS